MDHSPGFLKLVNAAQREVKEVDCATVDRRLQGPKDFILIDVREESEWNAGHIPGAIHIGKGVIERDIERTVPNRDQPLILYCGGGYRSILAGQNLQKMGYTQVLSMAGGWRGWTGEKRPVTK